MRTGYEIKSVDVAEVVGDARAENPACSSSVNGPVFDIFRIAPHQIAERTFMRHLNSSVNGSNLINSLDLGAETTMNAENLAINNSTNG